MIHHWIILCALCRDSLEEYLTADEREDSIEEAPSKAVREEEHSPDTQNTNSEACKEVVSPEEASEVSPPAAGSEDLPSTSVLQSSSSFANSAFWEAWHASNKGVCVCVCVCVWFYGFVVGVGDASCLSFTSIPLCYPTYMNTYIH